MNWVQINIRVNEDLDWKVITHLILIHRKNTLVNVLNCSVLSVKYSRRYMQTSTLQVVKCP